MLWLLVTLAQPAEARTCVQEQHTLVTGQAAPCTGLLVPSAEVAEFAKTCKARIGAEKAKALVWREQCLLSTEALQEALRWMATFADKGEAEDTQRLISVVEEECSWWKCPGWGTVLGGVALGLGAGWALSQ